MEYASQAHNKNKFESLASVGLFFREKSSV